MAERKAAPAGANLKTMNLLEKVDAWAADRAAREAPAPRGHHDHAARPEVHHARRQDFSNRLHSWKALLIEVFRGWVDHRGLRLGAALAYYTVFAITPLFLIVLAIAGAWFGKEAAREQLFGQLQALVGAQGGKAIQAVVVSADRPETGVIATVIAAATAFVGATGVFVELQDSLNTIWNVPTKPENGILKFIRERMLSFAMVLAIGFLLLVSLVVSAGLAALGNYVSGLLPAEKLIWSGINFTVSLAIITLMFAMIFKFLPDVKVRWREVWLGAFLSAVLFNLGKYLLGLYLGHGSVTSAYGAAGSLVVILVWVYYASQSLFLGAELTRVQAKRREKTESIL